MLGNETLSRAPHELETEAQAYAFLEGLRWGDDGPTLCPHCGSEKGAWYLKPKDPEGRKSKGGSAARSQRRVWKCRENTCRRQFSVLTNTVLHATKMPVRAWVGAIVDLCEDPAGVSARDIAARWDVTEKSAWAMLNRIQDALTEPEAAGADLGSNAPLWFELAASEAALLGQEKRARALAAEQAQKAREQAERAAAERIESDVQRALAEALMPADPANSGQYIESGTTGLGQRSAPSSDLDRADSETGYPTAAPVDRTGNRADAAPIESAGQADSRPDQGPAEAAAQADSEAKFGSTGVADPADSGSKSGPEGAVVRADSGSVPRAGSGVEDKAKRQDSGSKSGPATAPDEAASRTESDVDEQVRSDVERLLGEVFGPVGTGSQPEANTSKEAENKDAEHKGAEKKDPENRGPENEDRAPGVPETSPILGSAEPSLTTDVSPGPTSNPASGPVVGESANTGSSASGAKRKKRKKNAKAARRRAEAKAARARPQPVDNSSDSISPAADVGVGTGNVRSSNEAASDKSVEMPAAAGEVSDLLGRGWLDNPTSAVEEHGHVVSSEQGQLHGFEAAALGPAWATQEGELSAEVPQRSNTSKDQLGLFADDIEQSDPDTTAPGASE